MDVFAVSTVNDRNQVVLPRRVPLSQLLKDSESAFRSRLRKVHLHVDRRIGVAVDDLQPAAITGAAIA